MKPRPRMSSSSRSLRRNAPWIHGPIPVFGLVGGIGAGKSAVASRLSEIGAHVIDADVVGHALLTQRPVRDEVVQRFGRSILAAPTPENQEPFIDRKALGKLVFSDLVGLNALEAILHPLMWRTFEKAIDRTIRRGVDRAIVLDAAILFEAGWNVLCDKVIFVDAPRPLRLARLAAERGWDDEALAAREKTQGSLEEKKARADLVIVNDGDLAALRSAIGREWNPLQKAPPRRAREPLDVSTPDR